MISRRYTDLTLFGRLAQQVRFYWFHIGCILLLSLLSTPLALFTPLPMKIAVDSVIGSEPPPGFFEALLPAGMTRSNFTILLFTAGLVVVIALFSQLQMLADTLLRTYTGEKLVLKFRSKLFHNVQRLSLLYHDMQGTTDSLYRIQYDASAIRYIVIDGLIPFVNASVTLASMIYITFRLDWQLALVAIAVAPVLFLLARNYRRRLRRHWHELKELDSTAMTVVQETLAAIRVVKAFGQEDHEQERFVRHSSAGVRARNRVTFVEGGFSFLIGMTTALGTATFLFIGANHVQTNVLTLGQLLIVMSYLAQLYEPLKTMSRKVASLQSHLASAERAFSLLDEAPDVIERPNARPLARATGAVELRHVSFTYDGSNPVLSDICLQVPAGARVGLAGKTGTGKTTFVSLLIRFYDPTIGQIFLDGVDLRDFKLDDLRNQFSIVLQDAVLFSTSIKENIAYARPNASEAEIVAAAKAANAHEFIIDMAQGYGTQVGEGGKRLSGGERQRIALARAFLKDAPILILDEPTSSVDMKTEADIIEAMERLMRGRTTFMIAHRLSTLEHCDIRLVMENGRLVTVKSNVSPAIRDALAVSGLETAIHAGKAYN